MIRIHLQDEDLSHVRFGISPLGELVTGLRVAFAPKPHPLHTAWTKSVRASLCKLDLSPLQTFIRPTGYMPDFLTPPPTDGMPCFSAELERLVATPPERIRLEVSRVLADSPTPQPKSLTDLVDKPQEAVRRVADLLERCWSLALEPHWPQFRTLHEADIRPRATKLALGDTMNVLGDLHPVTRFHEGVLELHPPFSSEPQQTREPAEFKLGGRGLLLVPEVFAWPHISTILDDYWQPSLYYCPRGVGTLWGEPLPTFYEMLASALGQQRASVLLTVSGPTTTREIARRLQLTTANVSHHLGRLRRAGLVEVRREGRLMFYTLSARGKALLELFS